MPTLPFLALINKKMNNPQTFYHFNPAKPKTFLPGFFAPKSRTYSPPYRNDVYFQSIREKQQKRLRDQLRKGLR
jgi:hypothetical protein